MYAYAMAPNSDSDQDFSDEFDTSDNDNDPDLKHETNYEEWYKQAREQIRRIKRFTDDSKVQAFLKRYNDIAKKRGAKARGNLLHALVEVLDHDDHIKPEDVELLARRSVESWPDLLEDLNTNGHNPLYMAIRYSQYELVGYMIAACKDNKNNACLDRALSQKAQNGNTCLHAIFRKKPGSGHDSKAKRTTRTLIQRMLIEVASNEALAVQDTSGMTPMHYAVAFDRCTNERAELITLFIDRDLQAQKTNRRWQETFLDLLNDQGRSVYTEHECSRTTRQKKYDTSEVIHRKDVRVSKQTQVDTANTVVRLASRNEGRLLQQRSPLEPGCERKYWWYEDVGLLIDEREELRRKRKEEEQTKRNAGIAFFEDGRGFNYADSPMRIERVGERDSMRRAAARVQSTKFNESSHKPSIPALRKDTAGRFSEPSPNTSLKRSGTSRLDNSLEQAKSEKNERTKRMNELLRNSDAILLKLKLHYMRTRGAEMAIPFLYGKNEDNIQIGFDYDQLPQKIAWEQFEELFGPDKKKGLKFDSVLKYVMFPRVEVTSSSRNADQEQETNIRSRRQAGAMGRNDMLYFFDWLYKKGVRHIIKVSVDDSGVSGGKVHSEQAIQECLGKFVVEQLDWKKTDLGAETILSVSSKVEKRTSNTDRQDIKDIVQDRLLKKLYLRWGGSNAVLRGWSEMQGLPMLPLLQEIVLFASPASKTHDSRPWIQSNVSDFKTRLNAHRQIVRERAQKQLQLGRATPGEAGVGNINGWSGEVTVQLCHVDTENERKETPRDQSQLATSVPFNGLPSHPWLDSTDRFATEMVDFWKATVNKYLKSRQNQRTSEGFENDVVLALIDDGVDIIDTPETDKIDKGKSFEYGDGKYLPWYSSTRGHGTVMANMILRVCPMVKIYPIRLKTYDHPERGSMNIDAGYAAKAIQAALDVNATIISMSWTIPMNQGDSEAVKKLHHVLKTAVERRVLMFCSAPDKGKFIELDYPSGPWRDRFFRIGAARASGTVFEWTPDEGITYILPGVDVIPGQTVNNSYDARSGIPTRIADSGATPSNIATALAAGLAAMIIYCVKASVLRMKMVYGGDRPPLGCMQYDAAELIAHPDEMRRAFASLGRITPNRFIQVWEELDKRGEAWRWL
ncbi:hypothetical protein VTI28DRAFT_3979 [Corynascus sepedonium]